jgi:hypothetical protein
MFRTCQCLGKTSISCQNDMGSGLKPHGNYLLFPHWGKSGTVVTVIVGTQKRSFQVHIGRLGPLDKLFGRNDARKLGQNYQMRVLMSSTFLSTGFTTNLFHESAGNLTNVRILAAPNRWPKVHQDALLAIHHKLLLPSRLSLNMRIQN